MYRFILVLAVLVTSSAMAQDNQYNCKNPQYTLEMKYCAHQEFLRADTKLNEAYGLAVAATRQMDADLTGHLQGAEQALREAQRAWIGFRDAACKAEGFIFRGGTLETLLITTCETRLTRERTEGLRLLSEMN